MRTIAVINQKGGVGKTTTTANLAHALSRDGYKITAIDMDPQAHLGTSFGVLNDNVSGLDDVLLNQAPINDCVMEVRDRLSFVPAGSELGRVEQLTGGGAKRGGYLKKALAGQFADQDFVFIDCPPASGLLTANVLFSVDEVLIPVVGDYLSLQGVSYLMSTLRNFERQLGHVIKIWIVQTRYHKRRRLPQEIYDKLLEYFPGRVFETRIRETSALAECPSFGQTIFEYKCGSYGAQDYQSLARDLIEERTM